MTNFKNEFTNDEVREILTGKHDLATQKNVEKLLYLNDINQLPDSVYDSIVGSFEHNINCVGTKDWQKIIDTVSEVKMKYEIWQDNGVSIIFESDSTLFCDVLDEFCALAGYIDYADCLAQFGSLNIRKVASP